jgi:lactoylglutathione lyase
MNKITLNLVVLRSPDIARAAAFYTRLGLHFTQHRHGKGAEHFAAELPGGVFELYTQTADTPTTFGTRTGFAVPSVDSVIAALNEYPTAVISAPKDSEWGRRAVVSDPDGHRVELIESKP